jgi:Lipase
VICIDWEKGAALPNYVKAAANTRLVGKQLAIFLQSTTHPPP